MIAPAENWPGALEWLSRWEEVSPAARAAWLTLKPTPGAGPLPARIADELARAGLVTPPGPKGKQYQVVPEAKPLLRVLRAMDRVPVFDGHRGAVLAYLREHFTHEQVNLLGGDPRGYGWGSRAGELEERVSSVEWIQGLLELRDADAARRWEVPRRPANEPLLLAEPHTLAALQRLVAALKDHPQGVPLRQVGEILAKVEPRHRAGALAAGTRYLFLFPAIRREGAEAWVGLLPEVARRMGPPPPVPRPVQAAETLETPFRLADMTAVLVEAATEPIPVRSSDYALYVRAQKTIASRFVPLPAWSRDLLVTPSPDDDEEGEVDRIACAVGLLKALNLMQMRSTGDRYRFVPTPAGQRWLALGEGERVRAVLDAFRASPQRMPGSRYGDPESADFFGARFAFQVPDKGPDLRQALADAFLSVPAGAMVPLAGFLEHHARVRNPLLAAGSAFRRDRWTGAPVSRERLEDAWASLLAAFLFLRLVAFAGARLGRLDGGGAAFGLTDAGRYLLGQADDFALAPEPGGGEVVVQPDFAIVFLAPAPRAEAELGRIAERTGSGVGALFRLTRASVLRAAEQGMSAAQLLGTLESVSRTGVPDNVARQVRDWMKAVRTIRIAPAVLVDCPDAETAGRVRSLGGKHVTVVSPTLLRLEADAKTRAALVKRLREKGIFVGQGTGGAAGGAG
ncbi:MAG TPA: helicase-associated domain-containing protein [Longimicrobium sp.]|nr:helicase-associated domain-containing protein [Longimicrobium sp.]